MGVLDLREIFARVLSLFALQLRYILDPSSTQWLVLMRTRYAGSARKPRSDVWTHVECAWQVPYIAASLLEN